MPTPQDTATMQAQLDSGKSALLAMQAKVGTPTTPTNLPAGFTAPIGATINQGQGDFTQPAPLANPITAPSTAGVQPPTIPTPTLPGVADSYFKGLSTSTVDLTNQLNNSRDQQIANTQTQKDATQKSLDEIRTLQENGIVQQGNTVAQEKQAKLDQLTTEQTRFDENYNKVQGLATQLTDLMNQGNEQIAQDKARPVPTAIGQAMTNQTIAKVTAQTGVIQAAISVYNGQMNQARSQLIDSTNVITSAYKDQLDYYTTLNNFYNTKASDTGAKLIKLTADEKGYLDDKIKTLEVNLKTVQDNKDKLQEEFLDPTKALAFAQAGITLTTPQDQWGKLLDNHAYSVELSKEAELRANDGYTPLIAGQKQPAGTTLVTVPDSRGINHSWYKKASVTTDTTKPLTPSEITGYQTDFPDAGIVSGDTRASAEAKAHPVQSPVDYSKSTINGLSVTLPNGAVWTAPNQQALDQFKADNKIGTTTSATTTPAQETSPIEKRIAQLKNVLGYTAGASYLRQKLLSEGFTNEQIDSSSVKKNLIDKIFKNQ